MAAAGMVKPCPSPGCTFMTSHHQTFTHHLKHECQHRLLPCPFSTDHRVPVAVLLDHLSSYPWVTKATMCQETTDSVGFTFTIRLDSEDNPVYAGVVEHDAFAFLVVMQGSNVDKNVHYWPYAIKIKKSLRAVKLGVALGEESVMEAVTPSLMDVTRREVMGKEGRTLTVRRSMLNRLRRESEEDGVTEIFVVLKVEFNEEKGAQHLSAVPVKIE